ncbi:MAG: helix-hairpin-helix domain-containing protein [Chthonomonadales bacterium]
MKHAGQAFVPVLMVVLILTALAVALTAAARTEVQAALNQAHDTEAFFIAHGAVVFTAGQLEEATGGGAAVPQLTAPPDTDANGWTQLGDGWFKVDIIDTASRLNINTASAASLAKLPQLQNDPNIAAAIVDWRDPDDQPTIGQDMVGAESDYYQSLNPPYSAKNAPFDTIDELLLVRGITPDLLYGPSPAQAQALSSPASSRATRQTQQPGMALGTTGSATPPLAELVTTYSRELNVASDGSQRVNIKTASANELQTRLGITARLAQALVQARGTNGANINSIADLLNVPGFTRTIMQQIGDKITVTNSQYRDGVININTAPAEVLATIPGVDDTIYNAVIQWRQSGGTFNGLNDLFQLTDLNRQQLQTLVDHVCTKSSVYLLRVRVRFPGSLRLYAYEALVELTPQQPAQSSGSPAQPGDQTASGQSTAAAPANPRILQWRQVGAYPGWQNWVPGPNYYSSSGGTLGTP